MRLDAAAPRSLLAASLREHCPICTLRHDCPNCPDGDAHHAHRRRSAPAGRAAATPASAASPPPAPPRHSRAPVRPWRPVRPASWSRRSFDRGTPESSVLSSPGGIPANAGSAAGGVPVASVLNRDACAALRHGLRRRGRGLHGCGGGPDRDRRGVRRPRGVRRSAWSAWARRTRRWAPRSCCRSWAACSPDRTRPGSTGRRTPDDGPGFGSGCGGTDGVAVTSTGVLSSAITQLGSRATAVVPRRNTTSVEPSSGIAPCASPSSSRSRAVSGAVDDPDGAVGRDGQRLHGRGRRAGEAEQPAAVEDHLPAADRRPARRWPCRS